MALLCAPNWYGGGDGSGLHATAALRATRATPAFVLSRQETTTCSLQVGDSRTVLCNGLKKGERAAS